MRKAASSFPLGRLLVFLVVALGFLLVFQYTNVPTLAQEKESAPPQGAPAQPQVKPAPEPKKGQAQEKSEKGAIANDDCIACHNPDILKMSKEEQLENVVVKGDPAPPRKKPPHVFGELNLAMAQDKYSKGVHSGTTCVECHSDIKELNHLQRLKPVNCAECHGESVESIDASVHGKSAKKNPGCIGCHDVHYGKDKDEYAAGWKNKYCFECHKAYGLDTEAAHKSLNKARLHLALGCMMCHQGKEPGVHFIAKVATKVAACESCHNKKSVLSKEAKEPMGVLDYWKQVKFINADVRKKYGYVVGAHRIPLLDLLLILVVIGPLALPVFHGGLRVLTRRKEPITIPEEKVLLHPLTERIWHWLQAACIVMLIITGIMIHWPELCPRWFQWAVDIHNWFGWFAVAAFLLWLVYNLATKRITHYVPKKGEIPKGLVTQAKFYGYGIFKHEPHPYAPSEDNKFNPLQKIAYLQFQILLLPILLISGLIYMYPETFKGFINAIGGMTVLATVHYILGALFAAFLVAHLYLATTGETIGENFKAIVFGYGRKFGHEEPHKHA